MVRIWTELGVTPASPTGDRDRVVARTAALADAIGARDLAVALEFHPGTLTQTAAAANTLLDRARPTRPAHALAARPRTGARRRGGRAARRRRPARTPPRLRLGPRRHRRPARTRGRRGGVAPRARDRRRDGAPLPGRRFALCEYVRDDDPDQFVADVATLRAGSQARRRPEPGNRFTGMVTAELPKIISVDDHVVEPAHVWQTWLPEKYRERGPRVERKRWGAFQLKKGAKYEMTEDPEGEWGDAWIYDDKLIYVQKKFVAIPKAATPGGDLVEVRQDGHDDDRDDLRRHARRAAGTPVERKKDFELNWVDGSLPFPTFPRFCGQTFYEADDKELALACVAGVQRLDGRGVVRPRDRGEHPALHHAAVGRRPRGRGDQAQRRRVACARCASPSCRRASTSRASTPATGTRCSTCAPRPARPCACTSARRRPTRRRRRTRPPGVGEHGRVQQLDGVARRLPLRRDHAPVPEAEDRVLRGPDRVDPVRARAGRHGVGAARRLDPRQAPVPRAAVDLLLRARVRLLHLGPPRRELARPRSARTTSASRPTTRTPTRRGRTRRSTARRCSRASTTTRKYKILRGNAIKMLELDRV